MSDALMLVASHAITALVAAITVLLLRSDNERELAAKHRALTERLGAVNDSEARLSYRIEQLDDRAKAVDRRADIVAARERAALEAAERREENIARSLPGLVILGGERSAIDGIRGIYLDGERVEGVRRVKVVIEANRLPEVGMEIGSAGVTLRSVVAYVAPTLTAPEASS